MKPLISLIVWLLLNRETMRVPSANLSWIDVVDCVSSTTRPGDGVGAVVKAVVMVLVSIGVTSLVLPRVLPAPRKGRCPFCGSYTKQLKSQKQKQLPGSSSWEWVAKKKKKHVLFQIEKKSNSINPWVCLLAHCPLISELLDVCLPLIVHFWITGYLLIKMFLTIWVNTVVLNAKNTH